MIDNERVKQRAIAYTKLVTLTPEQRQKMIWDKLERGLIYARADKKRNDTVTSCSNRRVLK